MPAAKAETLTLPGSAHYHPRFEMLARTPNVSALGTVILELEVTEEALLLLRARTRTSALGWRHNR